MSKPPSARCLNATVTLVFHEWTKDAAGGRVLLNSVSVPGIPCQWDPGATATVVDETGRWTTEQQHVFRFRQDPGLNTQDVIRVTEGLRDHHCVVTLANNPAGRGVFFEVPAVERF